MKNLGFAYNTSVNSITTSCSLLDVQETVCLTTVNLMHHSASGKYPPNYAAQLMYSLDVANWCVYKCSYGILYTGVFAHAYHLWNFWHESLQEP